PAVRAVEAEARTVRLGAEAGVVEALAIDAVRDAEAGLDRAEPVAERRNAIEVDELAVAAARASERVDDRARRREPQRGDRRIGQPGRAGGTQKGRLGRPVAVLVDVDRRGVERDPERSLLRMQPPGVERPEVADARRRERRAGGQREEERGGERAAVAHVRSPAVTLRSALRARRRQDWGLRARRASLLGCAIAWPPSRPKRESAPLSSPRTATATRTSASRSFRFRLRSTPQARRCVARTSRFRRSPRPTQRWAT